MNQAGFVVIALAGLWIAYLVPHRLRFRQQLLESRSEDRFSEQLRVLRVARPRNAATSAAPGRVVLHRTDRSQSGSQAGPARPGGRTMDRPHATRDRLSADAVRRSAAEHARRAAHLDRRSAAARRRAGLTAVLLLAVIGGWSVVGAAGGSILLGAVPSVLLSGVLVLGRRAVVAGARADAAWAAGAADRVPLAHRPRGTGVVGHAVHPSEATTEVFARVPASAPATPAAAGATGPTVARVGVTARTTAVGVDAAPTATARTATERASEQGPSQTVPVDVPTVGDSTRSGEQVSGGSTWAPVPVPPPAYTLKPSARRAEPAPLVLDESHRCEEATGAERVDAAAGTERAGADREPAEATPTTGGLSLDAILARRRAAGE